MSTANDTLLLNAPVVRRQAAPAPRDRTPDLMRIVRHALCAAVATGPLDRAIRSAAPGYEASADVDRRALVLARRMNDLLAEMAASPLPADPHRETMRA